MAEHKRNIVVVGGSIAGLMAALKASEKGASVHIIAEVPLRRSSDVCHQEGIAAVLDPLLEGDSVERHIQDSLRGGDFLASPSLVRRMCEAAPALVRLCERAGVLFNRTPGGALRRLRTNGSSASRTVFADAMTGQQVLYALEEQVRRLAVAGSIEMTEGAALRSLIRDEEGRCRGVVVMNTTTHEFTAYQGDAVVLCMGGYAGIYGTTTASARATGAEITQAYLQGAALGNPEFILFHPTTMRGVDKARPFGDLLLALGAKLWVRRNERNWLFVDEWYPRWGAQIPHDMLARALHRTGGEMVNLDATVIESEVLEQELSRLVNMGYQCAGEDMLRTPLAVAPAAHYAMGGLWIDDKHMTTIPGLFAAGEADCGYHGACCLGANVILSALHGGMVAGEAAMGYAEGMERTQDDVMTSTIDREKDRQEGALKSYLERKEGENPRAIKRDLLRLMDEHVGIVRDGEGLKRADQKLDELFDRLAQCCPADHSQWANDEVELMYVLTRQLELARAVVRAALARAESRGAHYRVDYPERDDANWHVVTKVTYGSAGPEFSYDEKVETSEIEPLTRQYG